MSDCRNPHLSAYDRAEIEDAERSANAAESHGDAPRSVLSADTDTDKGEGAETTETEPNLFGDLFAIWKERKKISLENAEIFDNQSELGHDAENYSPDSREKFESNMDEDAKGAQDTREKLEEDVRTYMFPWRVDMALDWLDRQAAITEREAYQRGYDDGLHANTRAAFSMARQAFGIRKPKKYNLAHESEAVSYKNDDSLQDSREKLEADILAWRGKPASIVDMIPVWLDRQAAITTQECTDVYETGCEACRSAQKRKIAELQERVDNLCASEEIGNKLIMAQLETDAEQNRTIVEYAERVGELEAALKGERNNFYQAMESCKQWQREYESVMAERDMYREKLGRAVDAAHEIVRMVDER